MWAAGPEEVAALAGMPGAAVRAEAETLRVRLAEAHDRARDGEGLAPAEWELDRDLDDAVTALLRDQGDPPDPAALVVERARGVRRRAVVIGGLAAAGIAAGTWAVGSSLGWGGAADLAGSGALPPPGDPSWASTSTWAARGALAADEAIQALVIARSAPGSRLLWADDAGDRRIVVARVPPSTLESTAIAMWVGRRGADPGSLEEVPLTVGEIRRTGDAVAAVVPDGSGEGGLLVLLTRPRVLRSYYSPVVEYLPAGGAHRRWTEVELTDGAGASYVPTPPGPALRVRVGRYDGPPAGPQQVSLGAGDEDGASRDVGDALLVVASSFVAASSGRPTDGIRSAIVRYGITTGDVIDPQAVVVDPREGRVAVVHTTTADGALLRLGAGARRRPRLGPLPRPRDRAAHLRPGRRAPVRDAPPRRFATRWVASSSSRPERRPRHSCSPCIPTPTPSPRSASCARASASSRSSTPARPGSTASSSGTPTATKLGSWRQLFGRRDPNDMWPRFG